MSEIKVDTLTGKTTANDITVTVGASATMSLEQGLAKAWVNFDGTTTLARDSFNISSLDDDGTGIFGTNFSSSFGNVNYAQTAVCGNEGTSSTTSIQPRGYAGTTTTSASGINTFFTFTELTASTDQTHNAVVYHGDLA